jgi:hypothetical protein
VSPRHLLAPSSWRNVPAQAPADRQAIADHQLAERYPERLRDSADATLAQSGD